MQSSVRFWSTSLDSNARGVSNTVLEMDPQQCPATDIPAGTTYQWVRQRYLLPFDVSDIIEITDTRLLSTMARTSPEDNFWRSEAWYTNGSPATWCMVQSRRPRRWEVWLGAAPVDVRQYRYLYSPRWATNEIEELSEGTVSVSGDVATFSAPVLNERCIGAVLRISSNANRPTNLIGRYDRTDRDQVINILNPFQYERLIQDVTSTTTAVLSESIPAGVSAKAFTISSFVDVNREGMEDYLYRLAEFKTLQLMRADAEALGPAERNMRQALIMAMNADGRRMQSNIMRPYYPRPMLWSRPDGNRQLSMLGTNRPSTSFARWLAMVCFGRLDLTLSGDHSGSCDRPLASNDQPAER